MCQQGSAHPIPVPEELGGLPGEVGGRYPADVSTGSPRDRGLPEAPWHIGAHKRNTPFLFAPDCLPYLRPSLPAGSLPGMRALRLFTVLIFPAIALLITRDSFLLI